MGIHVFEPYKGGNQTFKKDGWYLKAFPVEHDGIENRGVFIMSPSGQKIVYCSDFEYIGHRFTKLGVNHFLIECNHDDVVDKEANIGKYEHVLKGHSSISTVCEFLRVNKSDQLKNVILCHLSDDNADAKDMVYRVKEVVGENVNVYTAGSGVTFILDE